MNRHRLEQAWNEYATLALSQDVPAIQRQHMRRAFYAGAEVVMTVRGDNWKDFSAMQEPAMRPFFYAGSAAMIAIGCAAGQQHSEEDAIDLQQELDAFAEDIKAGRG